MKPAMAYAQRVDPPPLDWGGHLLLLYLSEPERQARLTSWVRRGLELDEKVLHVAADEASGRAALSMLRRRGVDVATSLAGGRLEVVPPAPELDLRPAVERALVAGFRAVRICVAPNPDPTTAQDTSAAEVEREIERQCRDLPMSVLCQYQQRSTTGDRLRQAVATHLDGIWQRQLTVANRDGRLHIGGEVDISNDELFTVVMRCAADAATTTLHLDLGALRFLTAAGCRALIDGTATLRDHGGRLLIGSPQPLVERVLRIVGLNRLHGVELESRYP